MTKLGGALSGAATTGPAASAFAAALAGSRVCEPYVLKLPNGVELPCTITLIGSAQLDDIEGDVRVEMEARHIPNDPTTAHHFELARARRIMALAVRQPGPKRADEAPLGSLKEWSELPPETLYAIYYRFNELRELHDPLAGEVRLTQEVLDAVKDAIAKKNSTLLRYFGAPTLIAYLFSTVDQPASSPTPK